jgi:membrane complex biogenesis BtpA family protein
MPNATNRHAASHVVATRAMLPRAPFLGFVGVVHLPPMPGDPRYLGANGFAAVEAAALADAEALAEGGANAIIIENFGSAPFPKGTAGHRLPPHQVAAIALAVRACALRTGLPIGVNCLRNDAMAALGVAAAAGAAFVRINVHTGAYVTDQGLIEGEADASLRYRDAIGARNVRILADVLVKHASPLAPLDPRVATGDCLHRGLADGVVVTGEATGAPVSRATLEAVRDAAGHAPVLLGSGTTPDRLPELGPLADGAIVGTWLKRDGRLEAPVDVARVREMAAALAAHLRKSVLRLRVATTTKPRRVIMIRGLVRVRREAAADTVFVRRAEEAANEDAVAGANHLARVAVAAETVQKRVVDGVAHPLVQVADHIVGAIFTHAAIVLSRFREKAWGQGQLRAVEVVLVAPS